MSEAERQAPQSESRAEAGYAPDGLVLDAIKDEFRWDASLSPKEVANKFMDTYVHSIHTRQGLDGNPLDKLPPNVPRREFLDWCERETGRSSKKPTPFSAEGVDLSLGK